MRNYYKGCIIVPGIMNHLTFYSGTPEYSTEFALVSLVMPRYFSHCGLD